MGRHVADYSDMYTCSVCGEYGDRCGCGPADYGCTFTEGCPKEWHVHNCREDKGNCDQPERHLPSVALPIIPLMRRHTF